LSSTAKLLTEFTQSRCRIKQNGTEYRDYLRFSVMPFLKNTHKMKNLFSVRYSGEGIEDAYNGLENYLLRNQRIGVGSQSRQQHITPALEELYKKYNYEAVGMEVGMRSSNAKFLRGSFSWNKPEAGHTYYCFIFNPDWEKGEP
jgi:hypothetical protein